MSHLDRVPTSIPGLDPIIEGGLLKGGAYIILGAPGVGKTIFGSQVCFNHVAAGGKALYVTLLAESHARMLLHLKRMAFFSPEAVKTGMTYLSAFKILEAEALPEHTMVDGVIELTDELQGLATHRHLRVRKLRGASYVPGKHSLEISDAGLRVRPRLETQFKVYPPQRSKQAAPIHRLALGVAELDRMLAHGVPENSVTMVLGPSGSGKTTLVCISSPKA